MDKPVIIFGATGIAPVAQEIFESNGIIVYGFLDDDDKLHEQIINNIAVLGNTDDHGFLKLIGQKCEAFVATDDNLLRKDLVEMLIEQRKTMPTNAIHKHALIASTAEIGHGNFINARSVLGNNVKLGSHCIINSGAIVEHETSIGDFVQVGTGAVINSNVTIEEGAFIGSGAVIVSGLTIGKNARIGAGSVVVQGVKNDETVFGNPAASIKS